MREIALDTETTGFDTRPDGTGDRLVEIGCVELWDKVPTGKTWQRMINPLRAMSEGAREVTGYDDAELARHEPFEAVAAEFLDFIGDAPLVIHNAPFDMGFLNNELALFGFAKLSWDRVIDTLEIARKTFPGQRNSLDALCQRLGVDNSGRDLHGALIDADLLAQVYLELNGGRQRALGLDAKARDSAESAEATPTQLSPQDKEVRPPRVFTVPAAERAAHAAYLAQINKPIWSDYRR